MDERMNAFGAMVLAALEKQQNDIKKALMIAVNASNSEKTARDKFDMDASPDTFNDPAQPPVG